MELTIRPRRLRSSDNLRRMVRETRVSPDSLVYPLFLVEGQNIKEPIPSLDGQWRYSPDRVWEEIEACLQAGVRRVLLFGVPAHKDACGSSAWDPEGVVQQGIRAIKARFPECYVITDVCMCEYTSHGHCGILNGEAVDNDKTLEVLAKTALSHVQAGADMVAMVAPSDMMDGRIGAIRAMLDANGYETVPIMSYSAKYASAFYGPFRDAAGSAPAFGDRRGYQMDPHNRAGSAPAFGDRRGYQMDPHNRREALKECALDVEEGADILMVKPALSYLDIIRECSDAFDLPMAAYSVSGEYAMIKAADVEEGADILMVKPALSYLDIIRECSDAFDLPMAAYSVSGEYAMIKAAGKAGLIDEHRVMCESALSIYRAGANILITYFAKELAQAMQEGELG